MSIEPERNHQLGNFILNKKDSMKYEEAYYDEAGGGLKEQAKFKVLVFKLKLKYLIRAIFCIEN